MYMPLSYEYLISIYDKDTDKHVYDLDFYTETIDDESYIMNMTLLTKMKVKKTLESLVKYHKGMRRTLDSTYFGLYNSECI